MVANYVSGWQTLLSRGVAFAAIWWLASSDSGSTNQSPSPQQSAAPRPNPKAVAISDVELKGLTWTKRGFDNVMVISVTFANNGARNVKDIELTCEHFSNSGTRIGANKRVVYEVVSAGESKAVADFNMGFIHTQATKTRCHVSDLVLM